MLCHFFGTDSIVSAMWHVLVDGFFAPRKKALQMQQTDLEREIVLNQAKVSTSGTLEWARTQVFVRNISANCNAFKKP